MTCYLSTSTRHYSTTSLSCIHSFIGNAAFSFRVVSSPIHRGRVPQVGPFFFLSLRSFWNELMNLIIYRIGGHNNNCFYLILVLLIRIHSSMRPIYSQSWYHWSGHHHRSQHRRFQNRRGRKWRESCLLLGQQKAWCGFSTLHVSARRTEPLASLDPEEPRNGDSYPIPSASKPTNKWYFQRSKTWGSLLFCSWSRSGASQPGSVEPNHACSSTRWQGAPLETCTRRLTLDSFCLAFRGPFSFFLFYSPKHRLSVLISY